MKQNLYEILGVDPSSDKKEIKSAYRKMAKKNHPDTGGSKNKFALVKKAHDILMDDERRQKYDSTGDESEKDPDNSFGNAINCIGVYFNVILGECAQAGKSPLTMDMVQSVRSKLQSGIQENKKNLRIIRGVLDFDIKMKGRFTKKKKSAGNVFDDIISHRISSLYINISQIENAIKNHEDALEMIEEFSYRSDEPDPEVFRGMLNVINW